jgi:hypothetical protein
MPAPVYAANYTNVGASQTDVLINDGGSILVHGIIASAVVLAGTITINERDGSTEILTINVAADTSFEIKTSFLAKRGVSITTESNCDCTIFHSNAGA